MTYETLYEICSNLSRISSQLKEVVNETEDDTVRVSSSGLTEIAEYLEEAEGLLAQAFRDQEVRVESEATPPTPHSNSRSRRGSRAKTQA